MRQKARVLGFWPRARLSFLVNPRLIGKSVYWCILYRFYRVQVLLGKWKTLRRHGNKQVCRQSGRVDELMER